MRTRSQVAVVLALLVLGAAGCTPDAPPPDDALAPPARARLDALLADGTLTAHEAHAPADLLAIHDLVMAADEGKYAHCEQLLLSEPADDGTLSVIALEDRRGPSSGWMLKLARTDAGFAIESSGYSPCFYF